MYCCEEKPAARFVKVATIPFGCLSHLNGTKGKVCQSCLAASLRAQLDSKTFLDIGCPQCSNAWEARSIQRLMGAKDRRRYSLLNDMARSRTYKLSEELAPDERTMNDLLERGARQCPWCQYLFVKLGGWSGDAVSEPALTCALSRWLQCYDL